MKTFLRLATLALCLVGALPTVAWAQGFKYMGIALRSNGTPAPFANITVCPAGSSGTPCSPLSTLYVSVTLSTTSPNPFQADGYGQFAFYAPPGRYEVQVSSTGITTFTMNDVVLPCDPSTGCNGIFYVNAQCPTVAQALAAAVAAGAGVVDARGDNSASALALGRLDPGNEAPAITLLLGPYAYTATQITLRAGFHIVGMGGGSGTATGTQITATSTTSPLFIGPPLTTDQPAQHVLISDIRLRGPSRGSNSADCFFIDASPNPRGLQGVWFSEFRNLLIGSFGGVSLHFRGANAAGKNGVNQNNYFYNVTAYRGKAGGGEALRMEGANYQFYFYNSFLDSYHGNTSIDTSSTSNIFLGGGPGSLTSGYPYIIEFYGLTTEGAANLIQIDGASQVVFYGMHAEQAYGVVKVTWDQNGADVPTHGVIVDGASFNGNVGVNSGAGYIVDVTTANALSVQLRNSQYTSGGTPDNWVLTTSGATGVVAYNNSYGLPGGTATMLSTTTAIKQGTQTGSYTTTSTSFVAVDSSNLAFTTVVPVGWKLLIWASGSHQSDTASVQQSVRLYDTSTSTVLAAQDNIPNNGPVGWSMTAVLTGDGNSHAIQLQFETSNASDKQEIVNAVSGFPSMMFLLTPSN
jgi:hypothetical protein